MFQHKCRERLRSTCQLLGVFERALEDEPSHRIDVHRCDFAAEPHRFEWNGAAARERIQDFRRTPAVSLTNFISEPIDIGAGLATPPQNPAASFALAIFDRPASELLLLNFFDDLSGHAAINRFALLGSPR